MKRLDPQAGLLASFRLSAVSSSPSIGTNERYISNLVSVNERKPSAQTIYLGWNRQRLNGPIKLRIPVKRAAQRPDLDSIGNIRDIRVNLDLLAIEKYGRVRD